MSLDRGNLNTLREDGPTTLSSSRIGLRHAQMNELRSPHEVRFRIALTNSVGMKLQRLNLSLERTCLPPPP
jgi:hypothetical protein